jgi:GH15 family glucan-1,4-alpha-glucosidase
MELILRFDYGAVVPWVSRLQDGTWRAIAGPDMVVLQTPVTLKGRELTTVAEFDVAEGETIPFVLTYGASHQAPPRPIDPIDSLRGTESFWRDWSSRAAADGEWDEAVSRSLMVLKALTYAPTGGIVASPTTSLPEQLGGARNWDYRYCWLRDATLTLLALMNAGYREEAKAWRDWLLRAAAGSPSQLQTMYGLAGERQLREWEVDWLPGYEQSRPVRIGNAAHEQLQIDVFGEVMDALHQARRGDRLDASEWAFQKALSSTSSRSGCSPTKGCGKCAAGRALHVSKVMAWVAFDRAVKSVEAFDLDGPVDRWRAIRQRSTTSAPAASIASAAALCRFTVQGRRCKPARCRRPAFFPRFRGRRTPLKRSSATWCAKASSCDMTRAKPTTACRG